MMKLGLPLNGLSSFESDELTKAFTSGPKASHKYWRRVRVMAGGKLGWRYYYNTPKDRARFMEDRKKRKHKGKHEKLAHLSDEQIEGLHISRDRWNEHFAETRTARTPLSQLNMSKIFEAAGFTPPEINLDPAAREAARQYDESDTEPEDLWCKGIHPLRALEMAVELLPAEIAATMPDVLKGVEFFGTKKAGVKYTKGTRYKAPGRKAGAWALPALGKVVIPLDSTSLMESRPWAQHDTTVGGGSYPIHILLHEMAHIFEYEMKKPEFKKKHKSAPNWDDWSSIKAFKGRNKEQGITAYAETNLQERFCESFSAALLTPQKLATECPEAYKFMHRMMPSKVPSLDEALAFELTAEDAGHFANPFWTPSPHSATQMGAELEEKKAAHREPTDFYRHNPSNGDKIGRQDGGKADRFFEMSHGGRKVFFRYGMENDQDFVEKTTKPNTLWDPATDVAPPNGQQLPRISQIKEAFDEKGDSIPVAIAYLHLIQDDISDDTVLGVDGKTKITMEYIRTHGGFFGGDKKLSKLFSESTGKAVFHKVLRSLSAPTRTTNMKKFEAAEKRLAGLSPSSPDWKKAKATRDALHETVMVHADLSGKANSKNGTSRLPIPATITPHEITHNDFRQRSGAFNYDNFEIEGQEWIKRINAVKADSKEELDILMEMKEKFPGMLDLQMRRQPKGATQMIDGKRVKVGGRFMAGMPFVVRDPRTGKRIPSLRKITYTMDNPDGTTTKIPVQKGTDGRFRIKNMMWQKLLTPNSEDVRSAEHLAELCRTAAANKHRGWISVATDRPRRRNARGQWTVDPKGSTRRHLHMEVMFDGKGPPRLLGNQWKKKLGSDVPRIDQLLKTDPLGEKLAWAKDRRIIPAAQIQMKTPERTEGPPTIIGDRVVFTTRQLDWQGTTDRSGKKVVARLIKYIAGKDAGEAPPEPGWDRMPESTATIELENPPGQPGKLTPLMKDLIKKGLLPPWFQYTPRQRDWYLNTYVPARQNWKATFEAEKAKQYDPVYVFAGEINMGGGSKTFTRVGDDVMASIEHADETPIPENLENEALVYQHKFIDPRDGSVMGTEQRILLPKDGSVTGESLMNIPGVHVKADTVGYNADGSPIIEVSHATLSLEAFPKLRDSVKLLSHTDDIGVLLQQRVAMLKAAEAQRKDESHTLELDQIDPTWQADNWDTGLNRTLPNGRKFTLAGHQKRGIQKLFDNDLRVLLAHFMGTGKTVSALSSCKMAMARPLRKGMAPGEEIPPDLVGDERQKWLDDHPFEPGTLDPRNPKRCLVVAPLNTVEQWRQSAMDFDEGAVVVGAGSNDIPIDDFVAGIKDGTIDTDLVVVGPQYFTQHAAKLKECGIDGLVIDEVHQGIKNESAERNKVVNDWNPDMKMMMLLTGTPMTTSPADFVEYIRILSKDKQFAGMTKKLFTEEYLMKTPLPGDMGVTASAPKIMVRPEKLAEFTAIVAQWMDIALGSHVKDKVLPAVYIDASETSQMTGAQIAAYNLYMAALNQYGEGTGGISEDELAKLGPDARQSAVNAKAVSNCVGFKPASDDADATVVAQTIDKEGNASTGKRIFYAPDPRILFSKQQRGKNAGKWPQVEELVGGEQGAAVLDEHASEILGQPYAELAGKPIGWGISVPGEADPYKIPPTAAQKKEAKKRMKNAGWEGGKQKFANSDVGHVGIRFRGRSIAWDADLQQQIDTARKKGDNVAVEMLQTLLRSKGERVALAQQVQRDYRHALQFGIGDIAPKDLKQFMPSDILAEVARDHGITTTEAQDLLSVTPHQATIEKSVSYDSDFGKLTITTEDGYTSDPSGSLHLFYRHEDVDDQGKPLTGGKPFEAIKAGAAVSIDPKVLAKAVDENGKSAPVKKPRMPKGLTVDQKADWKRGTDDWAPPRMRLGTAVDEKGRVEVIREDTGEHLFVPKAAVKSIVVSLMEPGRRKDRARADIMMTEGNAKSTTVGKHIESFHDGSGPGPDGERQMVMFANGIIACRTLEAKLRTMGYRDVNEVIEGSPLHDPDDPSTKGGVGPNRKYFVTYIGSTFTGDREQNCLLFKKVKDSLGRDSKTSLFTDMNLNPRPASEVKVDSINPETGKKEKMKVPVDWMAYRGDTGVDHLPSNVARMQMSQFSSAQRETARRTLGINPPESFVTLQKGRGAPQQAYFYGAVIPTKVKNQLLEQFSSKDEKGRYKDKLVRTEDILSLIARTPDPSKQKDPAAAERFRKKIESLKAAYTTIAAANASTEPPLTGSQIEVFNNTDFVVCSDAAQVGINFGNASEMIMYDSLGSPMAEWQRMTRCARLLPEVIAEKLLGKPLMEKVMQPKRYKSGDKAGEIIMKNGHPVMVSKKKPELDEDGKPTGKMVDVLSQKRDELGRFQYAKDGIIDKIRALEPALLGTRKFSEGTIRGLSINFAENPDDKQKQTVSSALDAIAIRADAMAEDAKNSRQSKAWAAVAAQARTARNQGGTVARAQILKFKDQSAPDGSGDLISFPATGLPEVDMMAGTYDRVDTKNAEEAVRKAIQKMSDAERKEIMKAGFKTIPEPPHPVMPDPASLYMAVRAEEILTWIDTNQPVQAELMRAQEGGAVVTDEDVMNRMVQMLTPEDRAILKERKFLVNVKKIKASGAVGQMVKHKMATGVNPVAVNPEKPSSAMVHTGYEQEWPVKTEQRTEALGRARTVSNEEILSTVMAGVDYKTDADFDSIRATDLTAAASLAKALNLVFNLSTIDRAFNPLDLIIGGNS